MEEEKNSDLHLTCLADEMNDECDETILFTVIEKRAVLCVLAIIWVVKRLQCLACSINGHD